MKPRPMHDLDQPAIPRPPWRLSALTAFACLALAVVMLARADSERGPSRGLHFGADGAPVSGSVSGSVLIPVPGAAPGPSPSIDGAMIITAPTGIDDRMILAAPDGIDDAMVVGAVDH